ncbi:hypothetical protein OF83DRAFT_1087310 [Amylostereum chailletii]|nr:hypothetical protein OF83DRAFT_1087310 [Amylostereum chailletii]
MPFTETERQLKKEIRTLNYDVEDLKRDHADLVAAHGATRQCERAALEARDLISDQADDEREHHRLEVSKLNDQLKTVTAQRAEANRKWVAALEERERAAKTHHLEADRLSSVVERKDAELQKLRDTISSFRVRDEEHRGELTKGRNELSSMAARLRAAQNNVKYWESTANNALARAQRTEDLVIKLKGAGAVARNADADAGNGETAAGNGQAAAGDGETAAGDGGTAAGDVNANVPTGDWETPAGNAEVSSTNTQVSATVLESGCRSRQSSPGGLAVPIKAEDDAVKVEQSVPSPGSARDTPQSSAKRGRNTSDYDEDADDADEGRVSQKRQLEDEGDDCASE